MTNQSSPSGAAGTPGTPGAAPRQDGNSAFASPDAARAGSGRFFAWLRSLGITRADGWLGGVCGGIAIRTGLDPLIVRGIAIVVAILGGPALFFYAAGWLLLPDTHGEIHLERMLRGIFDAPLIAIAVLVALTFVPFGQGLFGLGHLSPALWWLGAPAEVLRVLWNLAIVGTIVWFIVWLVRRYRNSPPSNWTFGGPRSTWQEPSAGAGAAAGGGAGAPGMSFGGAESAGSGAAGSDGSGAQSAGSNGAGAAGAAATAAAAATVPEPGASPAAPSGADSAELADWRRNNAAWREQHAAWQEQQRAASRAQRAVRVAESQARARDFAAEAAERRRVRSAANPRAAGWVVALVLGVALIGGAVAGGIAATAAGLAPFAAPVGFAVVLLVIGVGMVVAGVARRRSGFLAFLAIATIVLGLASFAWPIDYLPVNW